MDRDKPNVNLKKFLSQMLHSAKICVLDTNVLLHNPHSLLDFQENLVVIPGQVIEELDEKKKGEGEIPYSARQVAKLIDSLIDSAVKMKGNGRSCIALPNGGHLLIYEAQNNYFKKDKADNLIVSAALELKGLCSNGRVVRVVSKDTIVRVKAFQKGLESGDYTRDKVTIAKSYGHIIEEAEDGSSIRSVHYLKTGDKIFRVFDDNKMQIVRRQRSVMSIQPKNLEQECAIDALMADHIDVVALTGRAGTGKTLLAIAAGLYLCTKIKQKPSHDHQKIFDQVMVARPIVPMGQDLGFLPGDIQEKLYPWMQPIYDNLDVIVGTSSEHVEGKETHYKSSQYLIESGVVHIEPLTYIRGRSLPRRYLIIDEAQNLRPLDIKTIITRCGEGTKVVFTGDLEQIDSPFLDAASNGLAYLINRYIDEKNFCYLNLKKSARSQLAERAAELL